MAPKKRSNSNPTPESADDERRGVALRRILEDCSTLRNDATSDMTAREVRSLRAAFNKTMEGVNPGEYNKQARNCDNLLWQLEKDIKGNLELETGDQEDDVRKSDWKFTKIPRRRRLQTLAVMTANFFTAMPLFLGLSIWLTFYPPTMPFMIIYWLVIYFKPHRHPFKRYRWFTGLTIWRHFRDYFPCRLVIPRNVKRAIDPRRNYMFCYHPHGVHSFGAMVNFGTNANFIEDQLEGITLHTQTLGMNFLIPFWREIMMLGGSGDASASTLRKTLRHGPGHSVVLVVGGAEESLLSAPKTNDLTLSKRRGFVKIALQTGAPLVPVFGFGETNCYGNWAKGRPWLEKLLLRMQKTVGFAFPLIKGRGIFNYNFGPLPHRRQIVTVIGMPLEVPKIESPTNAEIEKWHEEYVRALMKLYRDNRCVYDLFSEHDARVVN